MGKKKEKPKSGIKIIDSGDYLKTAPEKKKLTEKQLMDLLSDERKIDLKIEKELEGLKQSYIVLIIVDPKSYNNTILGLFRRFVNKQKIPGIYIAVNKSYERLIEELKLCKINVENVRIIDMITKMTGLTLLGAQNVDYLESATDLMELILLLDKRVGKIKERQKFIILDSVSTLLVYNKVPEVEKLIHALIEKVNKFKAEGILVMVKSKEHMGVIQTISQFCDRVAEIK
jgi:KaiC/GvpD/RAD55 family RecA-like ATPase